MQEAPQNHDEVIFDPESHENIVKFKRALAIVLNDAPTEKVDAIFFHTMSFGDDDEMFPLVAKLLAEDKADCVVFNGSDGEPFGHRGEAEFKGKAWAGKDDYIERLKKLGVKESQIVLSRPAFHTFDANNANQELAIEKGWKTAVTVNQPQQLVRATLGQIKSMQNSKYWMRLYSTYPEPWEAGKEVFGNQGLQKSRRFTMIPTDFERIEKYQKQGDLATYEEFFDYMKRRSEIK